MFRLIILNNQRVLYEGMASSAILPGSEEEISILPFHSPLINRLSRGIITIYHSPSSVVRIPPAKEKIRNEELEKIPIRGGIARMSKNELVILVE